MKSIYTSVVTLLMAAGAFVPANAATHAFNYHGSGISGSILLTYSPNPNTGVLPGTSPNPVDPIGSYIISGISGTFSDANIGISNAAITGIVLSNPSHPEPTNLLAPHSFGFYPVINGVPGPGGAAPGFSYDDLFYPGGSPQTASDYPFHGGFLDIYGMVFTLDDGNSVNFWSNGRLGGKLTYGAGVTNGRDVLDYAGNVGVPEPAAWARMLIGFGSIGATMRRRRTVVAA